MPDIDLLLTWLDEAFDKPSWHGPNLRGSLRGVSARQAAWRPAPGRHNIRELVLHAAYWKYTIRRRLTGLRRSSFARSGSNWFATGDEPAAAEWRKDLDLLVQEHRELRAAIAAMALSEFASESGHAKLRMVRGGAAHDLYHAGQIQLLKRLCPIKK